MASSSSTNPNRAYEDFDPPSDLVSEEACDTLLLYLPGFRKEQMRVQLTPSRVLKITGERPIGENKWRRFQKEFRVPSNCDTREVTAKFEGGILYIRQPKIITPAAAAQQQPEGEGQASQEGPKPQSYQPQPEPPRPPPILTQLQTEKDQVPPLMHYEEKEEKEDAMPRNDETPLAPTPQPQMLQEAPPSDLPRLEGEKGKKDEDRKRERGLITKWPSQVFRGSGLFRELRKPDNTKRLVISVVMVLSIGFYISYMFKSLTGNDQEKKPGSGQLDL